MSKTDRQTDRSTWWSVTAFNDEIEQLESPAQYPDWLKFVHGGREICPMTLRVHFQGALQCHSNIRFSQVKKWLPTAHIEKAIVAEALRKYCMKKDTAAGEKTVRANDREYWPMERALVEIGLALDEMEITQDQVLKDPKAFYWMAVSCVCRRDPFRIAQLSIPNMEKSFSRTYQVWMAERTRALVLQPAPEVVPGDPEFVELFSPAQVSNRCLTAASATSADVGVDAGPAAPLPSACPTPSLQPEER